MSSSTFIFDSFTIDLPQQHISFQYVIKHGEETITLVEKLLLPKKIQREIPRTLIESIAAQMHLAIGISYWKLFCPPEIIIKSTELSAEQATFWKTLYTKGLGEFFYRNSLNFRGMVTFPSLVGEHRPVSIVNVKRALVAIGGGKDSIVSIELLKKAEKSITGYSMKKNDYAVIEDSVKTSDIDFLGVQRVMDPQLKELNKRHDTYNGHIPISAIYAFVGILLAILYDYSYVIASNEHSADYGNVEYLGEMVNHQWSKSVEFEQMFRQYIHSYVTPDITYFSLLRPWNELKIAQVFVQYPQYFPVFSSCNRNFSSTHPNDSGNRWCGECPKCAFVFALLAAFISKDELTKIFGQNLYSKESLIPLYKELLGLEGFKPFECVGTPEETQVAMYLAHEKHEYDEDVVMKLFIEKSLPTISDIGKLKQLVFSDGDDSLIPEEFRNVIGL